MGLLDIVCAPSRARFEFGQDCTKSFVNPKEMFGFCARYVISLEVNPTNNVGLGVPQSGTLNQKASLLEDEKQEGFHKRTQHATDNCVTVASSIGEEVAT